MKRMHTNIYGRKSTAPRMVGKSRAAIALAVSLMCSCGVASANSGGEINNEWYRGNTYIGNNGLTDNEVIVNDATNLDGAYGAGGNGQSVSNNTITIDSVNKTTLEVVGATTYYSSNADPGNATDNHVIIKNSTVEEVTGGQAGDGNVSQNTVSIDNSTVKKSIWCGASGWHGTVQENIVTINNSVVEGRVYGGWSSNGDSEGITKKNRVTVKDSTVKENIYGGLASNTNENNIVTLDNAEVGGSVYGGYNSYSMVNTTGRDVAGNELHLSGASKVTGNVFNVEKVYLENAVWDIETPMLDVSGQHVMSGGYYLDEGVFNQDRELFYNGRAYNYGSTIVATIDASNLTFANPQDITSGAMMDLIKSAREIGATLAADTVSQAYSVTPVAGVTINAALGGSLAFNTDKTVLSYTAAANKATKLTFENVEWSENALINHAQSLTNVDFNGADVDTARIAFTNLQTIEANQKMTLVSDFGTSVGTITGTAFTVGNGKGEGHAYLENSNLRYVVTKGVTGSAENNDQQGTNEQSGNSGQSAQTEPVNYGSFAYNDDMGYYAGDNGLSNNNVLLDDSVDLDVADSVYGAAGPENGASVSQNTITVTSTSMKENPGLFVAGGTTDPTSNFGDGDAIDNHAIIKGKVSIAAGGVVGVGEARRNTVTVESTGVVLGDIMGGLVGGLSPVGATENSAIVNGGTVGGNVYGGLGANGGEIANQNTVVIHNGTVGQNVYGGMSDGVSLNNAVTLADAKVGGSVYGGYEDNSHWIGDGRDVQGNTLHLSGASTIQGNVFNVEKVYLENAVWNTDNPLLDVKGRKVRTSDNLPLDGGVFYDAAETFYNGRSPITATIDASNLTFENPENVISGESMDLIRSIYPLKATLSADNTAQAYRVAPVTGVTINAVLGGSLAFNADKTALTYTATDNKATKLTFENVEWSENALIDHSKRLTNVDFNGADVDTTEISFTNIQSIEDNQKMTLVSDFGTSAGTITGTTFTIGQSTGEGHAYLENNDLQYLVTRGVNNSGQTADSTDEAINQGGDAISDDVEGDVIGGVAQNDGIAEGNITEVLAGANVNGNVMAASSENGAAVSNTVAVTKASVAGSVIGATSQSGVVTGNKATVIDSTIAGDVVAAASQSGTVSNGNIASVTGGSVGGSIYGGKSETGEVNTSVAKVKDATVAGNVYGGMSKEGTANGNIVNIENTDITGSVYGGKSEKASDNNQVIFVGGTAEKVVGGGCETATGNIVIIEGDATVNNVYGAETGTSATNNQIFLGGNAKITGNVYGGYSASTEGETTGNSITLYDNADVSEANLYGGSNEYSVTGNNLYIGRILEDGTRSAWSGGGKIVGSIQNFDAIHFTVVPWSDEAALTVKSGNLANTMVSAENVVFTTNEKAIKSGETMTLLDETSVAATNRVQEENITKDSTFSVGTATRGTGKLSLDNDGNVLYTIDNMTNEKAHSVVMGAQAGMVALSAGNEFIDAAIDGLSLAENTGTDGISTFAQVGGGKLKQETGSHVNVNTWNGIIALGHKNAKAKSTTEYGAFFEYGRGNYTTHNGADIGNGSMHYTGGGVLAKWQQPGGFYVEGSLRAGSVRDIAKNVLRDAWGNPAGYNTNAGYWGAHIGIGREVDLGKGRALDLYGKYFMNRKNGVRFDTGMDHYDIDAINSNVLRIGALYSVKRDKWKYSGGLAYEYELDGEVTGKANGLAIRKVDAGGGSVRAELHATMTPAKDSPWSLDLNITGLAGKKRGVMGGASVVFRF